MNFYRHSQADFKMYVKAIGTGTPKTILKKMKNVRKIILPGLNTD